MKKMIGLALGAAVVALVACGGGGGGGGGDSTAPPVTTGGSEVPASAQQSTAGLLAYANEQIAASSDSTEPVVVGEAVLPVDDTSETSL